MKSEAEKMQAELEGFAVKGLAWAKAGPACMALVGEEARRAEAAATLAFWRERKVRFEQDREDAKRRSQEEIQALARSYFEGRPTSSLWERLRGGVKGLAGRHAIPATMEALGEMIDQAVREAEVADREAEEAAGMAREAARAEEHLGLAWLITQMVNAGVVPLLTRQAQLGPRCFAAIDPEKASMLEQIAYDAKWDFGHDAVHRQAVLAVGEVLNA